MKSVRRGSLLIDAVCVVRPNEFSPFWSLMSTSTISSTSTLKGWFLVSLVSYVATQRYVSVTKGWVTPLYVWVVSDGMITILQNKTISLNILYTIVLKILICIYIFCFACFAVLAYLFFAKSALMSWDLGSRNWMSSELWQIRGSLFISSLQYSSRIFSLSIDLLALHFCMFFRTLAAANAFFYYYLTMSTWICIVLSGN